MKRKPNVALGENPSILGVRISITTGTICPFGRAIRAGLTVINGIF